MTLFCIIIIILCFEYNSCLNQDDLPLVNTPLGKIRGYWKTSLEGRKYAIFEGVPYAKPPVGDLRFEEPQPVSPWRGTWEANSPQTCIQIDVFTDKKMRGSEDCLYLNIYVPAELLNSPEKFDVIVHIHAGGFTSGSGHSIEPSIMMDRNLVVVSINYRLSLFGFLSTEDEVIPGNNGMKDQVLALKWIRDNIQSFGGNPHSVTIVGPSAGGTSVHLHYFSPLSKGLFARGLSQAGACAFSPWGFTRKPLRNAKKLAVLAGCPDSPTEALKKCLKQRPAKNLVELTNLFYGFGFVPVGIFAPVVDSGSKTPFMDKEPYLKLKEGDVLDVPWITAISTDEALLLSACYWSDLDQIHEMWPNLFSYFMHYNDTIQESAKISLARKVLQHYLGPGKKIDRKNFKKFTQMLTDRLFAVPVEIAVKMQAKVTKSRVYYYLFGYREGENRAVETFSGGKVSEGVAHGQDCTYFYGLFYQKPFSEKDKQLKDACQDMLYSYAHTGKPSFDGSDKWKPTEAEELIYLNITGPRDMKLQKVKKLAPLDFWNQIEILANGHHIIDVKDEL